MFYKIEAVRWNDAGHIARVRWRRVEAGDETVVHGQQQEVPVVDAAQTCRDQEVRVYVAGDVGRFFKMKACPEGIDAEVDDDGTPLRERLAHLPTF